MTIRLMKPCEIDEVAFFISRGYYDDIFFKWCVPSDGLRLGIVKDYYKVYLSVARAYVYVAVEEGVVIGASVWLPHDVDKAIYGNIEAVAGRFAPNFAAVADASHASEPRDIPFTQLVGFAVDKNQRGRGVGTALLKTHLDAMDTVGEPTYLEASTKFNGGGVYGKFGYELYGDILILSPTAKLWPLFRQAK
ncbi:MAG: GNAT family N-acetyltransferase [Defluviitaleaceae bacterium]|nr:GNAT family N-acetyltransferase [Defluviitaleaceae bacterium]